jgi:hypothetical protein
MVAGPHPDPAALLAEASVAWSEIGSFSPPSTGLEGTRRTLHAVAENVLSPARKEATGNEIALRWYPGGFGTPPFPAGDGTRVLRVDGTDLVDSDGHREAIEVDPAGARFFSDWFCFGTLAIAELRVGAADELDPGWVQLWPEHFDVATELGAEDAGARAAYGASPGDDDHPEPYIYVAPWTVKPEGERWNATAFTGAELSYEELRAASDPRAAAAEFFAGCLSDLTA